MIPSSLRRASALIFVPQDVFDDVLELLGGEAIDGDARAAALGDHGDARAERVAQAGFDIRHACITSGGRSASGVLRGGFGVKGPAHKAFGIAQTWSGTYSMQSNCLGSVSVTNGDTASFNLGS